MTKLNKALMATTAIAFASGLALPAVAQDPTAAPGVVKSSKKMKLRLYGQITRATGVIDDGESTSLNQMENGNTSTRMGIDGRGKITKDISLRTRMEYQIQNGDSNQDTGQGNDAGALTNRHLDAIFTHKRFGAVWIGRGDTATNGTSEKNLLPGGSAGRLGGRTDSLLGDAIVKDGNDNEVDTLSKFFSSFDGMSRRQRIRYDTPTIAGFRVGASAIDKYSFDLGVHYKGTVGGVKVAGGFGYANASRKDLNLGANVQDLQQINGSVSILTPMGLGVTLAGGKQFIDEADSTVAERKPYNLQPAIFYTGKWTELGPTGIEYAYQYSEDITAEGDEGQGHSVMFTQVLANTGTDTFVTFRYYDVDRDNTSADDLWFFGAGFRARF